MEEHISEIYQIVDNQKIEEHITFIRINPIDIALTLRDVFNSLSDLSWIDNFDAEYIKSSFGVRAEATVKYIAENIIRNVDNSGGVFTTDYYSIFYR